jgi:hypothetical protein
MSYVRTSGSIQVPKFKSAKLNQALPVQNTWYTVADLKNVAFNNSIAHMVETTGETVELEVTLDDEPAVSDTNANTAGTGYKANVVGDTDLWINMTGGLPYMGQDWIYCKSVKVRIRKTTANGTGNLKCSVYYMQFGV